MFSFSSRRELEELEAIRELEEAAIAQAEAAVTEAAAAADYFVDLPVDDDNDSEYGDTGSETAQSNIIDVVAAASSRESLMHTQMESSIKYPAGSRSEIYQSYENGVDLQHQHQHHPPLASHPPPTHQPHPPHHHPHLPYHQSSSDIDIQTDRMSLKSTNSLSIYPSENSLTGRAMHAGGGSNAGGPGGGSGNKLSSLPSSPYTRRNSKSNSFTSHIRLHEKYSSSNSKKPLVLFTYLDAQEHLPYADDSAAVTPKSELNGGIVVDTPTRTNNQQHARKYSYTSHTGKVDSYNSHTDLRYDNNGNGGGGRGSSSTTKENALRKKMAALASTDTSRGNNNNNKQQQQSKQHSIQSMDPSSPYPRPGSQQQQHQPPYYTGQPQQHHPHQQQPLGYPGGGGVNFGSISGRLGSASSKNLGPFGSNGRGGHESVDMEVSVVFFRALLQVIFFPTFAW